MSQQHFMKRKRLFVTDVCRKNQLEDNALDNFAKLDTNEMLIALFAKLLAIKHAREHDELSAFIHSKQFKEILKDRMRSCLLSPNLTGYLSELSENIWVFMKKNLGLFKVPPNALEDPELSEYINSLVKDVLTKQRSTIKIKITTAINTQMHISHLAKSLAPPGYYKVTMGQLARFAFLRASLETFNDLVNKSMEDKVAKLKTKGNKASANGDDAESEHSTDGEVAVDAEKEKENSQSWNTTNFWEYVDSLLVEVCSGQEQGNLSLEQRKKRLDEFFTLCLQHDMKKYPTTK